MPVRTRPDGYERIREWVPSEQRERYAYVHQLVAIADGTDPEEIFSDGERHVHHRDGIKWHNAPDNLEVRERAAHTAHHNRERSGGGARV